MNVESMYSFLSEETLLRHIRYVEGRKAIVDALSTGKGKPTAEESALEREWQLHKAYFSSFVPVGTGNVSTEFLYRAERAMSERQYGFCLFYVDRKGNLEFAFEDELRALPSDFLAVDLYEHAYFEDYGFDRARYVKEALCRMDFAKISEKGGKRG